MVVMVEYRSVIIVVIEVGGAGNGCSGDEFGASQRSRVERMRSSQ